MSSLGMNVRPTMLFNGMVRASTTTVMPRMVIGWASAHSSDLEYAWSIQWKKPRSLVFWSRSASAGFRKRALSIGVSVKLTIIDTMIANAIVHPNG